MDTYFSQSGGTNTTITTGGNDAIFELPAGKVFNFAKSWFQFVYQTGPPAGLGFTFANFYPYFRQIQVYTRGGLTLMNLVDAHRFSRMTIGVNKKLYDIMTDHQIFTAGAGLVATPDVSINDACFRCDTQVAGNTAVTQTAGTAAVYTPSVNYTEPDYFITSSANTHSVLINQIINFYDYQDTLLALDKDLIFNETIVIRFVWNSTANISYDATSLIVGGVAMNYTGVTNNITSMELHLTVETNQEIVLGLQQKIGSVDGLSVLFDYPWNNISNLGGTQQTVSLRINGQNGLTLKKIYYSIFGTTAAGATTLGLADYDIDNTAVLTAPNTWVGKKLASFYTNLNNNRLMQYDYNCGNGDEYKALKYYLIDSIVQSIQQYKYSWVWIEDFSSYDGTQVQNTNELSGIDLSRGSEQKWDFIGTTTSATYNHIDTTIVAARICKLVIVKSWKL